MKVLIPLLMAGFLLGCTDSSVSKPDGSTEIAQQGITNKNLVYAGAFRVPAISSQSGATYAYAGTGLAYSESRNSLFMTAHDHFQFVGEISVPSPVISSSIESLPVAGSLQTPVDITEGNVSAIGQNGVVGEISTNNYNIKMGGLLIQNETLVGTLYAYYEDSENAKRSHFTSSLQLSQTGDFKGTYTVGSLNPGLTAGYMTPIPSAYQKELGGTILTGQACICIVSRSSYGPSAHALDPQQFSKTVPTPSRPLVYYPPEHTTLGSYENEKNPNPVYNMTTTIRGVVIPEGFGTALFFGSTGIGVPEYGAGTSDISLKGTKVPDWNEFYVYDPASPDSKGPHAWPYRYYVWAYSIEDMKKVAKGEKQPWEITPTTHWPITLPFKVDSLNSCEIGGVAYDPKGGRIFVSQLLADNSRPIIHVFEIKK